jgi:hypothetical protein
MDVDRSVAYVKGQFYRRVVLVLFLVVCAILLLLSGLIYASLYWATDSPAAVAVVLGGVWLVFNVLLWMVRRGRVPAASQWKAPVITAVVAAFLWGAGWVFYRFWPDTMLELPLAMWRPAPPVAARLYQGAARESRFQGYVIRQLNRGDFTPEQKVAVLRVALRHPSVFRDDVVKELTQLGPDAAPSVPDIRENLRQGVGCDPKTMTLLVAIGPAGKEAVPDLLAALGKASRPSPYTGEVLATPEFFDALGKLDSQAQKDAVPILSKRLAEQSIAGKQLELLRTMIKVNRDGAKVVVPKLVGVFTNPTYLPESELPLLEVLAELDPPQAQKVAQDLTRPMSQGTSSPLTLWGEAARKRLAELAKGQKAEG